MTDWNKLKVPELKAELKNRGLPQTGLKAVLVARLEEADNEANEQSAPEATENQEDISEIPESVQEPTDPKDASETAPPANLESEDVLAKIEPAVAFDVLPPEEHAPVPADVSAESDQNVLGRAQESSAEAALSTEAEPTLPSAEFKEVIEDVQKRKRRSQSPPPSGVDTPRKRARQDEDLPLTDVTSTDQQDKSEEIVVTSQDDAAWVEKHNAVDSAAINREAAEVAASGDGVQPGPTIVDVSKEEVAVAPVNQQGDEPETTTNGTDNHDIPASRQKDIRFKDLYSNNGSAVEPTMEKPSTQVDGSATYHSERDVSPALHPATSALYIRDFMRPLNPASVKEYLINLATPPGTSPNPEILVKFYLDPIRTHAFVAFQNISAASRVRSEVHDRIWPDERTRKPLWADFIPAERVQDWIDEEQVAAAGDRRGISTKKWEIAYDVDSDRNVTATLQETGAVPAQVRRPSAQAQAPPSSVTAPGRPGIEGAPLGPRAEQSGRSSRPPPPPSSTAHPPTPLSNDVKSTITQPVLYYSPVDPDLAERRLDSIDNASTKTPKPGNEINRYTFEDGAKLVDRGPEIFSGIRPPPGYRGRGGGGGGAGGPSFRGGRGGDRYFGSGRGGGGWDRDRGRDFRDATLLPGPRDPWVRDRGGDFNRGGVDRDRGYHDSRDRERDRERDLRGGNRRYY